MYDVLTKSRLVFIDTWNDNTYSDEIVILSRKSLSVCHYLPLTLIRVVDLLYSYFLLFVFNLLNRN